jgi:hypothetical protein
VPARRRRRLRPPADGRAPRQPALLSPDPAVSRFDRHLARAQHILNENEPIVCRPEETLECFLRTRMDALVLGDFIIAPTKN